MPEDGQGNRRRQEAGEDQARASVRKVERPAQRYLGLYPIVTRVKTQLLNMIVNVV